MTNYITQALEQKHLIWQLQELQLKDLLLLSDLPCNIWVERDRQYVTVLNRNSRINREKIKLLLAQHRHFFIHQEESPLLIEALCETLVHVTRSLSVGDKLINCKKMLFYIITLTKYLYDTPYNDHLLQTLFQCTYVLGESIFKNLNYVPQLYDSAKRQNHFYIHAHPVQTAILLIGFLKYILQFNKIESLSLFQACIFKDIGMSNIPENLFSKEKLALHEREKINQHPHDSFEILQDRIPLSSNYMNIIRNHHVLANHNSKVITGIETLLLSAFDTLVAMINTRPYREGMAPFEALNGLKQHLSKSYNHEFRMLVLYTQKYLQ